MDSAFVFTPSDSGSDSRAALARVHVCVLVWTLGEGAVSGNKRTESTPYLVHRRLDSNYELLLVWDMQAKRDVEVSEKRHRIFSRMEMRRGEREKNKEEVRYRKSSYSLSVSVSPS